jgi:hypothetical protein
MTTIEHIKPPTLRRQVRQRQPQRHLFLQYGSESLRRQGDGMGAGQAIHGEAIVVV